MTYEEIRKDPDIQTYIRQSDAALSVLGFTEHSIAHVTAVAERAGYLLETMEYPDRTVELVKIAAILHDIGNMVNRTEHGQSGAIMAFQLLQRRGFPAEEICMITAAVGNHDEGCGQPVSALAAALILADKSDIRRSRVRETNIDKFDIHDRVNYSVTHSELKINKSRTRVKMKLTVDTHFSTVTDFFEIFMERILF